MEAIKRSIILSADDLKRKIERIAYEIAEDNYEEKEIILERIADYCRRHHRMPRIVFES
jgi:pyrimidine operon attenuation protein/uracil phosphoribosyltransferase